MNASDARNNAELLQALEAGAHVKYLYFWGHTPKAPGARGPWWFSQWFAAPFDHEGARYPTAEHWMMAGKARLFGDAQALEAILQAKTPGHAKRLGRRVRGFEEAAWAEHRFELVTQGNVLKFAAPERRGVLLGTQERVLVEAAPNDGIWGVALDAQQAHRVGPSGWKGQNLLGYALMEARARLR